MIASEVKVSEKRKLTIITKELCTYGEFVGREDKLEELENMLNDDKTRFITIRGCGGIGKTALAMEAAKKFPFSRVQISLEGNPSSESVFSTIAESLHIYPTASVTPDKVREKFADDQSVLFLLDHVRDIKNAVNYGDLATKEDAQSLVSFFSKIPRKIKVLSTSRTLLGWPNEKLVDLVGLTPPEGMQVFRQWAPGRLNDIDDENAMNVSRIAEGHPLSIRLLGSMFNNLPMPINEFIKNLVFRPSTAIDILGEKYNTIEKCFKYCFNGLDKDSRQLLCHLRLFEIPFTSTLVKKAFPLLPIEKCLLTLWRMSWLSEIEYKYDPSIGDWRPTLIQEDDRFFTLHPQIRDFLSHQLGNYEGDYSGVTQIFRFINRSLEANSTILNNSEIHFYTALCYGVGFGVLKDLKRHIKWCNKAATIGHLEAQLCLAACYAEGAGGVGKDQKKAFFWYLEAAKAGDKGAQEEVQNRFRMGQGIEENMERSNDWGSCAQGNVNKPFHIKFDITIPLLHRIVENGQVSLFKFLTDQLSVKLDTADRHGRTLLHIAAEKELIEVLSFVKHNLECDVDAVDKNGRTPLHMAAQGNIKVVELLITQLGANCNAKDNHGRTPLHKAAQGGNMEVVRLLTDLKVDHNAKDNHGQTPLCLAVVGRHSEVVKLLIVELKTDISVEDKVGRTALDLAVAGKDDKVLESFMWKTELNLKGMLEIS